MVRFPTFFGITSFATDERIVEAALTAGSNVLELRRTSDS